MTEHPTAFIVWWFITAIVSIPVFGFLYGWYRNIVEVTVAHTVRESVALAKLYATLFSVISSLVIILCIFYWLDGIAELAEYLDDFDKVFSKNAFIILWAIICFCYIYLDFGGSWKIVIYPIISFVHCLFYMIIAAGIVGHFFVIAFGGNCFWALFAGLSVAIRLKILKQGI